MKRISIIFISLILLYLSYNILNFKNIWEENYNIYQENTTIEHQKYWLKININHQNVIKHKFNIEKTIELKYFKVSFDDYDKQNEKDYSEIKSKYNCYYKNDCWYIWWWDCEVCEKVPWYQFTYTVPNYWLSISENFNTQNIYSWETSLAYSGRWDSLLLSWNTIYDTNSTDSFFYPMNKSIENFTINNDIFAIYGAHIVLFPNYWKLPVNERINRYSKDTVSWVEKTECSPYNIFWNNIGCYKWYLKYKDQYQNLTILVIFVYNNTGTNNIILFPWEYENNSFWKIEIL